MLADVLGHAHRGEDLDLLGGEVLGVERDRLLHGREGQELQQVVLDDVARGADPVVVPGAAADADVLGHRDLHVVDVVRVPDRLEHLVGEPEGQQVLDRLLAEVVSMRNTSSGWNTEDTTSFSSRADFRSCPNGFSMTTRRQASSTDSDRPERASCLQTTGNALGGTDR